MRNFTKIADGPIRYNVDEKNRVVIATMHNTRNIAIDFLLGTHYGQKKGGVVIAALPGLDGGRNCRRNLGYLEMNDSYTARTFCHPDDTFDAETGIRIAREKLLRNVYKAFANRLRQYEAQLRRSADGLREQICQLDENNQ